MTKAPPAGRATLLLGAGRTAAAVKLTASRLSAQDDPAPLMIASPDGIGR